MAKYTAVRNIFIKGGEKVMAGSIVDIADNQAKAFGDAVKKCPTKKAAPKKS